MYTLFWEKGSGSIVVQALLEEMGAAYDRQYVDMEAGEHRESGYLGLNPSGLVPALMLPDSKTIGESAAIVLYLGDRCADGRLVPEPGSAERPGFLYWLMFMATSGYMTFARLNHPERYARDPDAIEEVRVQAQDDITSFFDTLESGIGGDPYFLACGFTALDIYLAMLAGWHSDRDALFRRNPKIAALCGAVETRHAYIKTVADHT